LRRRTRQEARSASRGRNKQRAPAMMGVLQGAQVLLCVFGSSI
jgi:hypothetical protein